MTEYHEEENIDTTNLENFSQKVEVKPKKSIEKSKKLYLNEMLILIYILVTMRRKERNAKKQNAEKPFPCPLCGIGNSRRSNLKRHLQEKHALTAIPSNADDAGNLEEQVHQATAIHLQPNDSIADDDSESDLRKLFRLD